MSARWVGYALWQPHRYARYCQDRDDCYEAPYKTLEDARRARLRFFLQRRKAIRQGYAKSPMLLEIRTLPWHELVEEAVSSEEETTVEAIR